MHKVENCLNWNMECQEADLEVVISSTYNKSGTVLYLLMKQPAHTGEEWAVWGD